MATYCIGNFVNDPSPNDRLIFIYNCSGKLTISIDPYASTFFQKSRYVYIVTDGKMNYDNTLDFATVSESEQAVARLNDIKKIFIDRTNNTLSGCVNLVSKCEFYDHTGNTHLHLIPTLYDALTGATNPSSANTFATMEDIEIASGDTKEVKVSSNDTTPRFLNQKITGSTYVNLEIQNVGGDEKLKIDVDGLTPLSDFETLTSKTYSKSEVDNNFLSANTSFYTQQEANNIFLSATTTIIDLSGYTTTEIDNLLTSFTYEIDFQNHTSDTSLHFTKDSILLDELGDVDTGGTIDGYYLKYSAGTWIGAFNDVDLSAYYTSSQTDNKFTTRTDFNSHTSDISLHINQTYRDAMDNSNNPSTSNPFATFNDITIAASGLTIPVADARYVKQTGDTMTGPLIINSILTVTGYTKLNNLELESGVTVNIISDDTGLTNSSSTALATENAIKQYVDSRGWFSVETTRYGIIYAPVDLLRGGITTSDSPFVAPYRCRVTEISISTQNYATWTGFTEVFNPINLVTPVWSYPIYINNEKTKTIEFENSYTIQKGYIIRMRVGNLINSIKYPTMTVFLGKK